jgi:hypothetical protein
MTEPDPLRSCLVKFGWLFAVFTATLAVIVAAAKLVGGAK